LFRIPAVKEMSLIAMIQVSFSGFFTGILAGGSERASGSR
jgi:hypothetical protein